MKVLTHSTFAVAVVLASLACGAPAGKPGKGDKLVDAQLFTLDGKPIKLSEAINGRVAVFKFGATWCGWCNKQLVDFNKVAKTYPKSKVAVMDIDVGEPAAKVRAHAKKANVTFTTVLDPKGAAAGKYNVSGIPVTIVAGHDGIILFRGYYTRFGQLKKYIDRALAMLKAGDTATEK